MDSPEATPPEPTTPPEAVAPPEPVPPEAPTWEDDENAVTLGGRALFTVLCAGFLAWSQHQALLSPHDEWNRWISLSVLANLLLPLGVVWFFFGQGLRHPEWLRDARLNAWNYGWTWRPFKTHLKIALIFALVLLPFLFFASRDEAARQFYRDAYFPLQTGPQTALWLGATLILYMFCWEWFFRGFLLFGLAQGVGPWLAIALQAGVFAASHAGKPLPELISSFFGGLILGFVAWKWKSFAPAFYTHAIVHLLWAVLIYV